MTVGYPDWGGSRLIKTPSQLFTEVVSILSPGNEDLWVSAMATGISYSVKFEPSQDVAGTIPFCLLEIYVTDQSGYDITHVAYDLPMGQGDGTTSYALFGPLGGNKITVGVKNYDTVAMSYQLSVSATNVERLSDYVTTISLASMMAGYSLPPSMMPMKGILGSWYQSGVGAGVSVPFLVPPAPGPVSVAVRADVPANPFRVTAAPYISDNSFGGLAHGNILTGQTDANGNFMATLNFPRSSMAFSLINLGSASNNASITLIYDVTSG